LAALRFLPPRGPPRLGAVSAPSFAASAIVVVVEG
jgi:hypothetical protein